MGEHEGSAEVSRRLLAAGSALGRHVGEEAAHACRVAIGKTVLRHAEQRARRSVSGELPVTEKSEAAQTKNFRAESPIPYRYFAISEKGDT